MPTNIDYAVVIPTRGRKHLVQSALESVESQTIQPSHVVVVVDGDVDGTVAQLKESFPNVEVIENEKSLGPAASRNKGLRSVRSEWVALLDDDDIWHHKKQETFQSYLLSKPECNALNCAFWQFSEPEGPLEINGFHSEIVAAGQRELLEAAARDAEPRNDLGYLQIEGQSLKQLMRRNCGVTSSTMFRRSLLDGAPEVPDELRTAEDWLLFVFLATQTEWCHISERLMFYRVHSAQSTKSFTSLPWRSRLQAWELAWERAGRPAGLKLQDYSPEYAHEVHQWFWRSIASGSYAEAIQLLSAATPYLSTRPLMASVLLPPPIRWRLRRYF